MADREWGVMSRLAQDQRNGLKGGEMSQGSSTTPSVHRIFAYGDHRFDDPGAQYTTEQVRQHLVQYFPELAHATAEEKTLPDGTVEVAFRRQVARKGSRDAGRLALLLSELEAIPPYEDPLAELAVALGPPPRSLAAILNVRDVLQTQADLVYGQASRTVQVVKRCLDLPPSPTRGVPLGF
jgi:PRTRC genetic system protein C